MVFLDTVQYRKNYFLNRNKVRTAQEFAWITVPVAKHKLQTPINEIGINNLLTWQNKCWRTIEQNYSKADYFGDFSEKFRVLYTTPYDFLVDLNVALLKFLFESYGIRTRIIMASELEGAEGQRDELLLSICRELEADCYLSGISGKEYLDMRIFEEAGIGVEFQEFYHPVYKQLYDPFIPCMSSIDLLFNHGPNAFDILKSPKTERLAYQFE